jgi:hypothetical protein
MGYASIGLVLLSLLLAACATRESSYAPSASPGLTPEAECRAAGGVWTPTLQYCRYR